VDKDNPYPVTREANSTIRHWAQKYPGTARKNQKLYDCALEYIREYEHGSVDLPDDVDNVEALAGVIVDFLLAWTIMGEE
jgi:hypothetical protein